MQKVALRLAKDIQGVKLIYSQSDEISLLLTDWDRTKEQDGGRIDTWYDYRLQKLVSVSASKATLYFNEELEKRLNTYNELALEAINRDTEDMYEAKAGLFNRKKNIKQYLMVEHLIYQ